jgi:hypothetical protein
VGVFDRSIATAKRLIDKYGQDCHWQKPAPDDGGTPGYPETGVAPDPIPVRMAFFSPRDLGRGSEEFMAMMAGMDVSSSKEIGLLAGGLTFEPDDQDHIIRDPAGAAIPVSIQKIDRLAPNGTPVLYYVSVTA